MRSPAHWLPHQIKGHIPENFFRPIFSSDGGKLTLEKDRFYILSTKERVSVPNHLSAEMVPFSHHVGELRAHYAGFFDPGFGYGAAGEISGTVGVLEVRPHETINIYHGQPICLMEFFRNSHAPSKPYGFVGSSYQGQEGPKLAKYFLSPVTRPRGIGSLAV
jgi:dCTP deaminase